METNYSLWTDIPYAGENHPPRQAEEPSAGAWLTNYFKRDDKGNFLDSRNRPITFAIKEPNDIDWNDELTKVHKALEQTTKRHIDIAKYWGTGVATKQFTPIIDRLIDTYGVTAPRAARIHSAVHKALHDAFVIAWDFKFKWKVARPNQLDQDLATIICTPRHPTYPSGHATIAGCAEAVLSYFFPAESQKLREQAEECAVSRLYGGVHFPIDNDEGLRLGRHIGSMIVRKLRREKDLNNLPIDTPYYRYRDADIDPPTNYKQYIPFKFNNRCMSLIRKDSYDRSPCDTPKPKLFLPPS
ncbi:phosphatase PAP2 family protein [Bacillus timonensis]|nr:phosphatase PAP2 family protein [Bacillus timonensis]